MVGLQAEKISETRIRYPSRLSFVAAGGLALTLLSACSKESLYLDCKQRPNESIELRFDTTQEGKYALGDAVLTATGSLDWRDGVEVSSFGNGRFVVTSGGFGPPSMTYEDLAELGSTDPIKNIETGSSFYARVAHPVDEKTVLVTYTCGPEK